MSLKPKIINLDTPLDETVYRIYIQPSSFAVDVTCLGTECYEVENFGKYVSDLPDWIQGKLAVLMMMGEDDYGHVIEGVGFRKDRHVFTLAMRLTPSVEKSWICCRFPCAIKFPWSVRAL